METKQIAISGFLIDNLTIQETLEKCVELMEMKSKPTYVCTLNLDFIANVWGFKFKNPRFVELQRAIENSDLIIVDGMPIIWLSRLLGCKLKERIAGATLTPHLIKLCENLGKSIFLLGGESNVTRKTVETLQIQYPSLKIAGFMSPIIPFSGETLLDSDKIENDIINQINTSKPDLLLIAFGTPKQELWFQRNQHRLNSSLSIGIGGVFNFISGSISRAPLWMQKWGFEWLFRLIQEPRRLWRRYTFDAFHFLGSSIPLLTCHYMNLGLIKLISNKRKLIIESEMILFESENKTICILILPIIIPETKNKINILLNKSLEHDVIIVDFKNLLHINSEGVAELVLLWKKAKNQKKKIYGIGLKNRIKALMILHHCWYIFQEDMLPDINKVISDLSSQSQKSFLYSNINYIKDRLYISFFGELNACHNYEKELEIIKRQEGNIKKYIINLRCCSYIDTVGIRFLLKIQKLALNSNRNLILTCLSDSVIHSLKMMKLISSFNIQ